MSNDPETVYYAATDRKPDLNFEFEGVDLSSFSAITFRLRQQSGLSVERSAVIDDAANGLFHIEWQADDLPLGSHEGEIVFEHSSGIEETWPAERPIVIVVRQRV